MSYFTLGKSSKAERPEIAIQSSDEPRAAGRDARLSLLKGLAILLVLCWHLQPIKMLNASGHTIGLVSVLIQAFNYEMALVAVPVFFTVSLFLFFQRADLSQPNRRRIARLRRVSVLFLFWGGVQFLVWFVAGLFPSQIAEHDPTFGWSIPWLHLLIFGGPPLPLVGDSVFYYLSALIVLMLVAWLYMKMGGYTRRMVGKIVVIGTLLYFLCCPFFGYSVPYWRIDCFVVYVPVAFYAAKNTERFCRFWAWYLFSYLLFASLDLGLLYTMRKGGMPSGFSEYARVSVVAGAVAMTSVFLRLPRNPKVNLAPLLFLGNNTLGIFALHKYFQLLFVLVGLSACASLNLPESLPFFGGSLSTINLVASTLTFVVTVAVVYLSRYSFLKTFLT